MRTTDSNVAVKKTSGGWRCSWCRWLALARTNRSTQAADRRSAVNSQCAVDLGDRVDERRENSRPPPKDTDPANEYANTYCVHAAVAENEYGNAPDFEGFDNSGAAIVQRTTEQHQPEDSEARSSFSAGRFVNVLRRLSCTVQERTRSFVQGRGQDVDQVATADQEEKVYEWANTCGVDNKAGQDPPRSLSSLESDKSTFSSAVKSQSQGLAEDCSKSDEQGKNCADAPSSADVKEEDVYDNVNLVEKNKNAEPSQVKPAQQTTDGTPGCQSPDVKPSTASPVETTVNGSDEGQETAGRRFRLEGSKLVLTAAVKKVSTAFARGSQLLVDASKAGKDHSSKAPASPVAEDGDTYESMYAVNARRETVESNSQFVQSPKEVGLKLGENNIEAFAGGDESEYDTMYGRLDSANMRRPDAKRHNSQPLTANKAADIRGAKATSLGPLPSPLDDECNQEYSDVSELRNGLLKTSAQPAGSQERPPAVLPAETRPTSRPARAPKSACPARRTGRPPATVLEEGNNQYCDVGQFKGSMISLPTSSASAQTKPRASSASAQTQPRPSRNVYQPAPKPVVSSTSPLAHKPPSPSKAGEPKREKPTESEADAMYVEAHGVDERGPLPVPDATDDVYEDMSVPC